MTSIRNERKSMSVSKYGKGWCYRGKVAVPGHTGTYKNYFKSGFKTKKEALSAELSFRQAFLDNKSIQLKELIDMYLDAYRQLKNKYSSYCNAVYECNYGILPFFESTTAIDTISRKMLCEWQQALMRKGYKMKTFKSFRTRFSALFNFAVRHGFLKSNPLKNVPWPGGRKEWAYDDSQIKYWTPDVFEKALHYADGQDLKAIMCLGFWAGLRIGEIRALKWKNVDLKTHQLTIEATITDHPNPEVKSYQNYDRTDPKTFNSFRTIDISGIINHLLEAKLETDQCVIGWSRDSFIFGTNKPVSYAWIARRFQKAINLASVPRITFHGLRHSHASWLIFNKIPDPLIAERLGHTIATLRSTYAHIYQQSIEELLKVMNSKDCQIPETLLYRWMDQDISPKIGFQEEKEEEIDIDEGSIIKTAFEQCALNKNSDHPTFLKQSLDSYRAKISVL